MSDDEVRDLADRIAAKQRRGEEWRSEFSVEFWGFTAAEKWEYVALMEQRNAHRDEELEAIKESLRIARLLHEHQEGAITAREFVNRVHGTAN
jgi:hypothetical protein